MSRITSTLRTVLVLASINIATGISYVPKADIGYPAGLLPECPGVQKNATISARMLPNLKITLHKILPNGLISRQLVPIGTAPKIVAKDKSYDFRSKKTMLYAVGFLDSSIFPHSQAIGTAYAKRGYNVFITETVHLLTYIYPKSVRITKVIGMKVGEFLVKLMEQGLSPDDLELVGASLGGHLVGAAAKYIFEKTGFKPFRVTGLDPAGPCFRSLPEEFRLSPNDGQHVDVIHTNIDGFGIAERLGHIDVYVNGGEYQPGDIPYIPCLVVCSHIRSILYWWQALEHPKKFIGVKCASIQEARLANCFNNTDIVYMGLETDFSKSGIYYLPTHNEFPYYRGKAGLKAENEIYTSITKQINAVDLFEA
ncbi:phospholipase A1-like [Bombyx mandarina]|uniref:Phospholipase A1-like n=1 Tax=Bombyx mandarina TaxID=7092 RepID=A0A6J2K7E5_BOMMA|nr:phospholipase A1-like [Bombyx mandarina]